MPYKKDKDLEFLQHCDNADLDILVGYITKAALSEELTPIINSHPGGNHRSYWQSIAYEIQTMGGNTIANIFRGGEGVLYKEVLIDVAKKMKVNFNPNTSVEFIESSLLMKVLTDSLEKMDSKQLKEVVENLNLKTTDFTAQAVITAIQAGLKGFGGFAVYQTAVIVANAVAKAVLGRGLTLAGNAILTRTIGVFLGPIGWVITGLWALKDLAGPAFRVTIPSVVQIAYMRAKLRYEKENTTRKPDKVKIKIFGEKAVGKTTLLDFLLDGKLPADQKPGTPTDFAGNKTPRSVFQLKEFELNIEEGIDIPGHEEYVIKWKDLVREADIVIYLFDGSKFFNNDQGHLRKVENHLYQLKKYLEEFKSSSKNFPFHVFGVKIDLCLNADKEKNRITEDVQKKILEIISKLKFSDVLCPEVIIGSMKDEHGKQAIAKKFLENYGNQIK